MAVPIEDLQSIAGILAAGYLRYKGRSIVVKVRESGFEYDGEMYKSLSAVARVVTGTKWNGFLFFGLASGEGGSNEKR